MSNKPRRVRRRAQQRRQRDPDPIRTMLNSRTRPAEPTNTPTTNRD